ncbi:hypothetical protein SAMN04488137_0551 [Fictibacillus solisalsi]|uniref:Uncharacterized protein n=1 Tax=Fictibacillus solisalsi TaxID=459525 RepID=A0A1G9TWK7_9BACL|nr:hypothetical protein SAMN04488137_0551 [Fictibacillus solisalsi]
MLVDHDLNVEKQRDTRFSNRRNDGKKKNKNVLQKYRYTAFCVGLAYFIVSFTPQQWAMWWLMLPVLFVAFYAAGKFERSSIPAGIKTKISYSLLIVGFTLYNTYRG